MKRLKYQIKDLDLCSGSAPCMIAGLTKRMLGGPERMTVSPAFPAVQFNKDVDAYGLNTLGISWGIFVLYLSSQSNMCAP